VDDILARLIAIRAFRQLPEAPALAAANKRVSNLLKKAETNLPVVEQKLLTEAAERQLYDAVQALQPVVSAHVSAKEYTAALSALAGVRQPVDAFFDEVMVMVDDLAVRANRLALLARLDELMNQVADIGLLPG
jgi:glycyl-tRNA synthetase beta chain